MPNYSTKPAWRSFAGLLPACVLTALLMNACSNDEKPAPGGPTITSFSPASGLPGSSVEINGANFSATMSEDVVKFNGATAEVTAATATSLTATVPQDASTGKISVTVNGKTASSAGDFVLTPVITSFTPQSGTVGTEVTISGMHFGNNTADNTVKFNDTNASVSAASPTSLTVAVPDGASTGKITVVVNGALATSNDDFVVLPSISSFSPFGGPVGSEVVITGSSFGSTPSDNVVKFNSISATVEDANATSLTVLVPQGATTGKITVTVSDHTATSSDDFEVFVGNVRAGGTDNDEALALVTNGLGDIYIAGRFTGTATFGTQMITSQGNDDAFVAKYNSNLEPTWVVQLGGASSDAVFGMNLDGDGNVIVCGEYTGTGNFGSFVLNASIGSIDAFVAKLSPGGDVLWAKSFGGSLTDDANDVAVDADGDVYVAGAFGDDVSFGSDHLTASDGHDGYIAKLDGANGDPIWETQISGTEDQFAECLKVDNDGNVLFAGDFFGSISLPAGNLDAGTSLNSFVGKLGDDGGLVWMKQITGDQWNAPHTIALDGDNNLLVTGYFTQAAGFGSSSLSAAGNEDGFLAKYGNDGTLAWATSFGGSDYDRGISVTVDESGKIYLSGYFTRTATFGDTDLTSDSNSRDIFVSELSGDGDFNWTHQASSSENDYGNAVAIDASGKVCITGSFSGEAAFSTTMTSAGASDIYIWRILP